MPKLRGEAPIEDQVTNKEEHMEMDPIELFERWYAEEISLAKVRIPSACCLSTIGTDGFPNARFVSLKEVEAGHFIVTGPVTSRKGIEIGEDNKVALTFWWTETERQVRLQGVAEKISEHRADKYFAERDRSSQFISIVSEQGKEIDHLDALIKKVVSLEKEFAGKSLARPVSWGGYFIKPLRIEFLDFSTSRFHIRTLYEFRNSQWSMKQIQP